MIKALVEMAPLDMRTLTMLIRTSRGTLANLAVIQPARHYGVPAHTYGGYADARLPSADACMQKVLTALPCILAGGWNLDAGKLGGSLCSPIQIIIDSDLISAVQRMLRGFVVNDEKLGVDVIDEVGSGGSFLATEHTVKHMRPELWQPRIWARDAYHALAGADVQSDTECALHLRCYLGPKLDPEPGISEETERRLQSVVDCAARNL